MPAPPAGVAGLALLALLASCQAEPAHVTVADGCSVNEVSEPHAGRAARLVSELLASCSVDSTPWAGSEEKWQHALSGPHILVSNTAHPRSYVAGRPVSPDDILLPLPSGSWPDHVLVRDGPSVLAFTKYAPQKLAVLILDDGLGLREDPRFARLCEQLRIVQPR